MQITVKGNVGNDIDLKFSKNNKAYATFSLAYTPRTKQGDEWVDGDTTWFRVVQFDKKAEALADSIKKGDSVVVVGEMKQSTYKDRDGNDKSVLEITATDVGLVPRLQSRSKAKEQMPSW
jgi:single-strand DNA-binding protein